MANMCCKYDAVSLDDVCCMTLNQPGTVQHVWLTFVRADICPRRLGAALVCWPDAGEATNRTLLMLNNSLVGWATLAMHVYVWTWPRQRNVMGCIRRIQQCYRD